MNEPGDDDLDYQDLCKYFRSVEEDAVALNMTGLTLEMMGLYQSATQAYEMAISVLKQGQVRVLFFIYWFFIFGKKWCRSSVNQSFHNLM